ncbi:MAG: hypothetical protein AMXMBFR64_45890 [Myxococcales bacterium]
MGWGAAVAAMAAVLLAILGSASGGCAASGTASLGTACTLSWESVPGDARVTGTGACRLPPGLAAVAPHGTEPLLELTCTARSPWAASWMQGARTAGADALGD